MTPSHSCHKRSVSCLPSDCISVSVHSALLIVCNHGFVSGALTHTSLHATSALPPPNLLPSPAPLSCARLAPKGIAVTVKRPGSPCLTTRVFVRGNANVSPLILSCHLRVTPASAPLRAGRSLGPGETRHSCKLAPAGHFQYLSFLLSTHYCAPHKAIFGFIRPPLHCVGATPWRRWGVDHFLTKKLNALIR